jgi:hypothetical protein
MRRGIAHFFLTLGILVTVAQAQEGSTDLDGLAKRDVHDGKRETAVTLSPLPDWSAALIQHDAAVAGDVISAGPFADVIKNLELKGRGSRLLPSATTDVWVHGRYAYIGTFNDPCGDGTGDNGSGIRIYDIHNRKNVREVGHLPSVAGSRSNDVKVAAMSSGTILVHSNERCTSEGPGGFEIWNVDDPLNPIKLAHVQTDDISPVGRNFGVVDVGVHNLFLFSQNGRDYVAAVVESVIGGFQIFDITDPSNPTLVGFWGAEQLFLPDVDWPGLTDGATFFQALDWLRDGFGQFRQRFLHDVTISDDGTRAYLSHWDAGLVLLDISDPTEPQPVSVALDPTSGDGEVNSHAAWPSADGSIVVEANEDFNRSELSFQITSGPNAGEYPAFEGGFTTPIASLAGLQMSGPTVYVGLACPNSVVPTAPSADAIALIQRGDCRFDEKAIEVINAGYAGMVVFNDEAGGDAVFRMTGDARNIPGVFVGHTTGLRIAGVTSASELMVGVAGENVAAQVEPNFWGDVRIWDYSDPANPVLASTFKTVCAASPFDASCDQRGTYSVHNAIVETFTEATTEGVEVRTKAYLSWYSDGVLVLAYNPAETARYHREGPEFEAENGGIQDVWGIYKVPGEPWIYASDRNGGLYVLKELGRGTGKKAEEQVELVASASYLLEQNRPNPFNPSTTIVYSVPQEQHVDLVIHDVAGRLVRTLVSAQMPAGRHEIVWDGTNTQGTRVGSGIYFYTLRARDFSARRKLVMIQ